MRDPLLELSRLRALSAELGADEMLVQAGGGNTSLKTESGLWIKASGTRLSDAESGDIFLFLPWDQLNRWSAGDGEVLMGLSPGGRNVRASVETAMHLALPHRFVAHTHSVRGIRWLVCPDQTAELEQRLSGLHWARLPYVHPGRHLADAIRVAIDGRDIDLLLLENHGLVFGADDSAELMRLISEVESRLDVAVRPICRATSPSKGLALPGWVQQSDDVGMLSFDGDALRVASGGTLYPDHCVYLGPSVAVAPDFGGVPIALTRYKECHGVDAKALFIYGTGAFLRESSSDEARAMLRCLVNVVNRIEPGMRLQYLPASQVKSLMAWDAEEYRRKVAAETRENESYSGKNSLGTPLDR